MGSENETMDYGHQRRNRIVWICICCNALDDGGRSVV